MLKARLEKIGIVKIPFWLHLQGGYFDGLRSSIGGLTQRVKSWYWGRPIVSQTPSWKVHFSSLCTVYTHFEYYILYISTICFTHIYIHISITVGPDF